MSCTKDVCFDSTWKIFLHKKYFAAELDVHFHMPVSVTFAALLATSKWRRKHLGPSAHLRPGTCCGSQPHPHYSGSWVSGPTAGSTPPSPCCACAKKDGFTKWCTVRFTLFAISPFFDFVHVYLRLNDVVKPFAHFHKETSVCGQNQETFRPQCENLCVAHPAHKNRTLKLVQVRCRKTDCSSQKARLQNVVFFQNVALFNLKISHPILFVYGFRTFLSICCATSWALTVPSVHWDRKETVLWIEQFSDEPLFVFEAL